MTTVKKSHGRVWKNTRETMLLLQNGRNENMQTINLYKKESYMARNQVDCEQSLFSWKTSNSKSRRALTCFAFFPADFREKKRLLAV